MSVRLLPDSHISALAHFLMTSADDGMGIDLIGHRVLAEGLRDRGADMVGGHLLLKTPANFRLVGRVLAEANVASYNARYGESLGVSFAYAPPGARLSCEQAATSLVSFDCQSGEVAGWYESLAFRLCQLIRERVVYELHSRHMVEAVDGIDYW